MIQGLERERVVNDHASNRWHVVPDDACILHLDEADLDTVELPAGAQRYAIVWRGDTVINYGFVTAPAYRPIELRKLTYLAWEDPRSHRDDTVGRHTVSVVICTRDRPGHLTECLERLALQSRQPDEIIIVDNASVTEETKTVTLAAGATYLREDREGLSYARNTGVQAARGEIIAFTDDDVLMHPHWLANLVAAFDAPEIEAATGLVLPAELKTEAQRLFERTIGFARGLHRQDFGLADIEGTPGQAFPVWRLGAGASMAFRKSVFDKVGYFHPDLGAGRSGCSEDSELWYRILAMGGVCRYEPSSIAFHIHRRDLPGLQSQLNAYMRGHVVALRIQGNMFPGKGNIRRIWIDMPKQYGRRLLRRLIKGRQPDVYFLFSEIAGVISGVFYPIASKRVAK